MAADSSKKRNSVKTGNNSRHSLRKVVLIGPMPPYRGGIAQYTSQLQKSMSKLCDLQTVSFKRLYPKWLYPGENDKEPGMENYRAKDVDYALDIYSPFSVRKLTKKLIDSGAEVVIFTWWTIIWQPGFAMMARRLKKRGIKVVFLCHNIFDHDAKGAKRKISQTLLKLADGYIVHSTEEQEMLTSIVPTAPVMQRILPVYGQFSDPDKHMRKRGRLEVLFFGFIRPYKGLDVLVKALAELQDKQIYLTVVGEAWEDVNGLKERLNSYGAANLELQIEYVDEVTAANYFSRADVVALPYLTATGSAVLSLAYHYKKPVVASRVGGLPDGVVEGKTGWLFKVNSPESLSKTLQKITREKAKGMKSGIDTFCRANSWDAMARQILEFCGKLD